MSSAPAYATTADGSQIAWYDFGGSGEPIVLVHATGFCAQVLEPMAQHLGGRFRCVALDCRWHGRSRAYEGFGGDWRGFRDDVLAVLQAAGLERPVGFGHSCGGTALLLAEELAPGTFSRIYCYEAVVTPVEEPPPPSLELPLAAAALRRRDAFASKAEAVANFSSKAPLSTLHPAVLRAYVEHGFESEPDGSVTLRCRPHDEARIYSHGYSHAAYRDLFSVEVPVTLACGALSESFGPEMVEAVARRLRAGRTVAFEGLGHLGPMERPDVVAASVIRAADTAPA